MTPSDNDALAPVTYLRFGGDEGAGVGAANGSAHPAGQLRNRAVSAMAAQQGSPRDNAGAPGDEVVSIAPIPTEEELAQEEQENFDDALRAVERSLARKDLSSWEATQILKQYDLASGKLDEAVAELTRRGYLDDYAYAERQIESLRRRKGFGRSQLSRELGAKRVASEIISDALESIDADSEHDAALALAQKRAPSLARFDRETAERRLSSFLLRKGYSGALVREVVKQALGAAPRLGHTSTVRFR